MIIETLVAVVIVYTFYIANKNKDKIKELESRISGIESDIEDGY